MATVHREPNQVKWIGVRPGHNGEQVLVPIDLGASAIVYTVPADKLLLLFDWHLGIVRNVDVTARLEARTDGAVVLAYLVQVSSNSADPGFSDSNNTFVPIELSAAYDLYVTTTTQVRGYIHGILIDV